MALPGRSLVQLSAYEDTSAIAEGSERFSGKRAADTAVERILVEIDHSCLEAVPWAARCTRARCSPV